MSYIYRSPSNKNEFEEYFAFRWEQLRKPLNLPIGTEKDDLEKSAFHMAAFYNDSIVGIGRLHFELNSDARIRYMAVHEQFQNQMIGSTILNHLENHAITNNAQKCWLYARENAINFYHKNGYVIKGKNKSELSEIKHKRMEKRLTK